MYMRIVIIGAGEGDDQNDVEGKFVNNCAISDHNMMAGFL